MTRRILVRRFRDVRPGKTANMDIDMEVGTYFIRKILGDMP